MSHNCSKHYQFVMSLSVGIDWDPVHTSGVIWRRAVGDTVWDAVQQGRLSFCAPGPFNYSMRELRRRNLIELWRMNPPVDNHFLTLRKVLLPNWGNDSKEKAGYQPPTLKEVKRNV